MAPYVIEAGGRATMIFPAEDGDEADDFAGSDPLRDDFRMLRLGDAPLWDGDGELFVRPARDEEEEVWEAAFVAALRGGDAEPDDREDWAVFLVPVALPDDDTGSR